MQNKDKAEASEMMIEILRIMQEKPPRVALAMMPWLIANVSVMTLHTGRAEWVDELFAKVMEILANHHEDIVDFHKKAQQ